MGMIFRIDLHTSTPGNSRRHWRVEARRAKGERQAAYLQTCTAIHRQITAADGHASAIRLPLVIDLTRFSPGRMDRHNIPGALKHVIDGIADALHLDDGDPRLTFRFAAGKSEGHFILVSINRKGEEPAWE